MPLDRIQASRFPKGIPPRRVNHPEAVSLPNAGSCLRLVHALAVETHENWLEANRYRNMAHLAEQKKKRMRKIDQFA